MERIDSCSERTKRRRIQAGVRAFFTDSSESPVCESAPAAFPLDSSDQNSGTSIQGNTSLIDHDACEDHSQLGFTSEEIDSTCSACTGFVCFSEGEENQMTLENHVSNSNPSHYHESEVIIEELSDPEESDSDVDSDGDPDDCPDLSQDLAEWFNSFSSLSLAALRGLLLILRSHGLDLPADPRTILKNT